MRFLTVQFAEPSSEPPAMPSVPLVAVDALFTVRLPPASDSVSSPIITTLCAAWLPEGTVMICEPASSGICTSVVLVGTASLLQLSGSLQLTLSPSASLLPSQVTAPPAKRRVKVALAGL